MAPLGPHKIYEKDLGLDFEKGILHLKDQQRCTSNPLPIIVGRYANKSSQA